MKISIFFKYDWGSTILEVLAEDTVEQRTAKIADKEKLNLDEIRLIYAGKALDKGRIIV